MASPAGEPRDVLLVFAQPEALPSPPVPPVPARATPVACCVADQTSGKNAEFVILPLAKALYERKASATDD